jgi:hypothetical protein
LDSKWWTTGDASFHKQHRNNNEMPYTVLDEKGIEIAKVRNDNDHYHRPLPATDFQYSWIHNALNGEDAPDQFILERAPKNGMIKTDIGYHEAIKFDVTEGILLNNFFINGPTSEESQTPETLDPPDDVVLILSANRAGTYQVTDYRSDDTNYIVEYSELSSIEPLVATETFQAADLETISSDGLDSLSFSLEFNNGDLQGDYHFGVSINSAGTTTIIPYQSSIPQLPTFYYNPGGPSEDVDYTFITFFMEKSDGSGGNKSFGIRLQDATVNEPSVSLVLRGTNSFGQATGFTENQTFTMNSSNELTYQFTSYTLTLSNPEFASTVQNIPSCTGVTYTGTTSYFSAFNQSTTNTLLIPSSNPVNLSNVVYASGDILTINLDVQTCNGFTDNIIITINDAKFS